MTKNPSISHKGKRKPALSKVDAGLLRAMEECTGETVSVEDFLKELRNDRKNG